MDGFRFYGRTRLICSEPVRIGGGVNLKLLGQIVRVIEDQRRERFPGGTSFRERRVGPCLELPAN